MPESGWPGGAAAPGRPTARQEEADNLKQRYRCEKQQNKNKITLEDLEYDIHKAQATLKRLEDDATELGLKMKDMKEMRGDEYNEFTRVDQEDTTAVDFMEQVIVKLSGFFNGADEKKASFVPSGPSPCRRRAGGEWLRRRAGLRRGRPQDQNKNTKEGLDYDVHKARATLERREDGATDLGLKRKALEGDTMNAPQIA
jgi:hypothetical protein